ncbi:MAG: hypothetical protein HC798_02015 [Polaribacter sp.]|nr:hypothetical protein [Polaribacter sp.]
MNQKVFITKLIENKTITWFETTNQYLVLEPITADILKRIARQEPIEEIALAVAKKLNVPYEKAVDFIINLKKDIYDTKTVVTTEYHNDYRDLVKPKRFEFTKHYQFGNTIIAVNYQSLNELDLVHPKFEHIVIDETKNYDALFEVFTEHGFTFFND